MSAFASLVIFTYLTLYVVKQGTTLESVVFAVIVFFCLLGQYQQWRKGRH